MFILLRRSRSTPQQKRGPKVFAPLFLSLLGHYLLFVDECAFGHDLNSRHASSNVVHATEEVEEAVGPLLLSVRAFKRVFSENDRRKGEDRAVSSTD